MEITPHEDYGFFGPDSVTWKVWSYPTSLTVGFQRAVVIEELDPAFADLPIVRKRVDDARIDTVMSNGFGFGGTNGCLVMARYEG